MKRKINKFYQWLAWHMPPQIVLWCFVRVMALGWEKTNKQPDEVTYSEAYKVFESKFNLKEI